MITMLQALAYFDKDIQNVWRGLAGIDVWPFPLRTISSFADMTPKKLNISICLMLNWYGFVKSQPNFIIFVWEEDILNVACKLISTILCDWHYLVVCQHNSRTNFILKQHRKRTILFLQDSVETRNRCCEQYMYCFVENLFRCKSAKNYKILLRFHKAISI